MWFCDECYKCSLSYKRKHHWDTKIRPNQLWTVEFAHNSYLISLSWVLMKRKEEKRELQTAKNHLLWEQFPSEPHSNTSKQQELSSEYSEYWHFPWIPTLKKGCFMICVALLGLQVFRCKEKKWIWGGEKEEHKPNKCKHTGSSKPCSPTNSFEFILEKSPKSTNIL